MESASSFIVEKVTRTVNGKANVSTESAGTSTVKYSYDKSGNVKSVKNSGKSTSFGYTVTTTATSYTSTGTSTYVYDAVNSTSTMTSDMVTNANAEVTKSGQYVASETTSSNTVKYVYSTKANTNRITSRTAITSKIKVDGISKSYVGLDYTTYKVRKISVPTDRLFDVETAMWRLTNGI